MFTQEGKLLRGGFTKQKGKKKRDFLVKGMAARWDDHLWIAFPA